MTKLKKKLRIVKKHREKLKKQVAELQKKKLKTEEILNT